jgi:hypothetical protein
MRRDRNDNRRSTAAERDDSDIRYPLLATDPTQASSCYGTANNGAPPPYSAFAIPNPSIQPQDRQQQPPCSSQSYKRRPARNREFRLMIYVAFFSFLSLALLALRRWERVPPHPPQAPPHSPSLVPTSLPVPPPAPYEYNIAIIGAGPAGVTAAHHLSRLCSEHDILAKITIYEQSSHIGGRAVHNVQLPIGESINLGAHTFRENSRYLVAAAKTLGLGLELSSGSQYFTAFKPASFGVLVPFLCCVIEHG